MFDCVIPTRNARNGHLFTSEGIKRIRNAKYKNLDDPIDKNSDNPVCKNYSAGYIHHLFNAKEMLGGMLLSLHNIYFYQSLMADIRKSIEEDRFMSFSKEFLESYKS